MKKFIIILLAVIAITCSLCAVGCSGCTLDSEAVVVSAEDFYKNKSSWLSGGSSVSAASSSDNQTIDIGEEYFLVFSVKCHSGESCKITNSLTLTCSDVTLTNFTDTGGNYYSFDYDYSYFDADDTCYVSASIYDETIEVRIYMVNQNPDFWYRIAIGFCVNSECEFSAAYQVTATKVDKETGRYSVLAADSGEKVKSVYAYYEKQVKINTLTVSYLNGTEYNNGEFSDGSLSSTLNISTGEYAYMIIEFEMEGIDEDVSNDKITIEAAITPSSYCLGRIQDANTSSVTDETVSNGVSIVNATYSIPEKGKTRSERIIIRIEARVVGDVTIQVYFYNENSEISASGNSRYTGGLSVSGNTDGIEYELNSDGQSYTVVGIDSSATAIDIPYLYNGLAVTAIAEDAFYGCSNLTNLSIPDSVTSLSSGLLSDCVNLTTLTLPYVGGTINVSYSGDSFSYVFGTVPETLKNVTVGGEIIPKNAFSGCSGITELNLSGSVTYIGAYAFTSCTSLEQINLPDSVTYIGSYAFYNCSSLVSVNIPDGVTEIYERTFQKCSSLESIEIGKGVTNIGQMAFSECESLTELYLTDLAAWCGVTFELNGNPYSAPFYAWYNSSASTGTTHLYLKGALVTELVIPESVTTISSYAFYACKSIKKLTVHSAVTDFGSAFEYSGIQTCLLEDGVTEIGDFAFYNCRSLNSIEIPDSVTDIGKYAFYGCTLLETINLPEGIASIGNRTFYNCKNLTEITIPDSVTSIDVCAFYNCSALSSIAFSANLTSIGASAFYNCSALSSVTFPATLTSIGASAFSGCSSLKSATFTKVCNWYVQKGNAAATVLTVNLPSYNASKLTGTYVEYKWYC